MPTGETVPRKCRVSVYPCRLLPVKACPPGGEIAQPSEWNHHETLPWHLLNDNYHASISKLVGDLNRLYCGNPALHKDSDSDGFYWLSWEDSANSILSFARRNGDEQLLVVLNFTPVPHDRYRIGVPMEGAYEEILNSDSQHYGGSNFGNGAAIYSESRPVMGQPYSLQLKIPPLGGIVLRVAALTR